MLLISAAKFAVLTALLCMGAWTCARRTEALLRELTELMNQQNQKILELRKLVTGASIDEKLDDGEEMQTSEDFILRHSAIAGNFSFAFLDFFPGPLSRPSVSASRNRGKRTTHIEGLVVALSLSGELALYSLSGDPIHYVRLLDSDNSSLQHIAAMSCSLPFAHHDDHYVVLLESSARLHSFAVRVKLPVVSASASKGKIDQEGNQIASSYGLTPTIEVVHEYHVEVPASPTVLKVVQLRGVKYSLVGDLAGGISVYMRNGTLKGRVKLIDDVGGVIGLVAHHSQIMFYTPRYFGLFSPATMDTPSPPCKLNLAAILEDVVFESNHIGRVLLSLSDGQILSYDLKDRPCTLLNKLPQENGAQTSRKIFPVPGYLVTFPIKPQSSGQGGVKSRLARFLFLRTNRSVPPLLNTEPKHHSSCNRG
eukprot:TRINITY_DN102706_c0_g1_i3.p1 TRINITY_DN102706_c0_g1~~TRINITY_DN102706_c0_g1_i3.p1  ORF type:complete len:423 (-),score=27.62 TRINITY_DN102706_c0_g1_i3:665-1933(-)